MTTFQQDPVTEHCRPVTEKMEQLRQLCQEAGLPATVYPGTSLKQLALLCADALTGTGGAPCAVIAFESSRFGNHPRRTTTFSIIILSADTRPAPGIRSAIDAAWELEKAVDRRITETRDGDSMITDIFTVAGEEALEIADADAACAVMVTVESEDY